ncbi:MAG: hypothetical protein ACRD1X_04865 [Vicinamibacteria bacterium]
MAAGRGEQAQRRAFEFFRRRFVSAEPFTSEELSKATGWSGSSSRTYLSKQATVFTEALSAGRYRVTQAFRRYRSWKNFKRLVTQTRRPPQYQYSAFDDVLVYEFLLPLSNEEHLRGTLDTLFYEDTIQARLQTISQDVLQREFTKEPGEDDQTHSRRLLRWISEHFLGYSVYHVQGRFRAGDLSSRAQALKLEDDGDRYLVDETTAVARFIFKCLNRADAKRVQFFFWELFVKSIVEVVSGEEEIWMVESGIQNRVHVWSVKHE